ncbi:hypothetical protein EB796_009482 [Bugula neritina]|uniref:Uncharacterized protein n=1 Tax=Bugula neritina TaxID=10212 RepID=A0A7J7K1Y2_BUGNE|nr:hypothetical protein EB796_009482 [Bugula neritina]
MSSKDSEHGSSYPGPQNYLRDDSSYYLSNQIAPGGEPTRMYASDVIRSQGPSKFNWHIFRSAFVSTFCCWWCWCCGCCVGGIGLMYSILSYVDYNKGDFNGICGFHSMDSDNNFILRWIFTYLSTLLLEESDAGVYIIRCNTYEF